MKLDTNSGAVQGSMTGQRVDMVIDADARAHIMQALQGLYADQELAVIREISTNARDAHVDAGCAHLPIEVTLPTGLDPYFRVKDYGKGLSVADIENIYSRYGASTKRDTNDQVGSLGFGCKSPLAYTSQFSLTSVCDGLEIVVLVSKDEEGGNMTILDPTPTDKHSGVTVEVPAARWNNFKERAHDFYRFWESGTVLVNGSQPEPIKGQRITDKLMVIEGHTDYVVMGNVPYPLDRKYLKPDLRGGYALVARVDIGTVNFPPSREALRYTQKTRDTLAQVDADFTVGIKTVVQNAIDACKTRPEVIQTIVTWRRTLPESRVTGGFTFKGKRVPYIYEVPGVGKGERAITTEYGEYYDKLSAHNRRERLEISWWVDSMIVYGYDRDGFTAPTKKKLKKYADDNGLKCVHFILLPAQPKKDFLQWFDKSMVVDFKIIAAIKLPRSYAGGRAKVGRIPGSYDMFVGAGGNAWKSGREADKIDQTKAIFWKQGKYDEIIRYVAPLNAMHPDCTIVALPANRVGKFLRSFPQAIEVYTQLREDFTVWKKSLTENQKIAIRMRFTDGIYGNGWVSDLKPLDPSLIDDRELKRAVRIARKDHSDLNERWKMYFRILSIKGKDLIKYDNPLLKYPLYNVYLLNKDPEHVYQYLNAIHAYLTRESN